MGAIETAWSRYADELARWTYSRLLNRADVWGGYWRGPGGEGGPVTRPSRDRRTYDLTAGDLARHFLATRAEDIVGLHAVAPGDTCKWIAVDIDAHTDDADGAANERAAIAWEGKLKSWGVPTLLSTSNGSGGFHLRGLLAPPAPAADCYAAVRFLVSDFAAHGLTAPPETFPKQRALAVAGNPGQYGNWLRLPGRHHKRDYWSALRLGGMWLRDDRAAEHVLGLAGGELPLRLLADLRAAAERPEPPKRSCRLVTVTGDAIERRIIAYLRRCPNLKGGQGRDDVAYQIATFLLRDLALSEAVALPWLELWDAGNSPPKGADRLREIMRNATEYGRRAIGGPAWN